MSKGTLKDEIDKISLTKEQRQTVNNHFIKVRDMLERMGYGNIQKQGSFGRGTVIKGQESDGFDLDIALVVPSNDTNVAMNLNYKIKNELQKIYSSPNQTVTIGDKAVKVKVRERFGIDVTQIYKGGDEELVYSSFANNFQDSYALSFRNLFKQKNNNSQDNILRDLCRIYKHIRDSINDVEIKSLPLEILIYKSFALDQDSYINSMLNTLKNFHVIFQERIRNNTYQFIENPAYHNDKIDTKINNQADAENILKLNTIVIDAITAAWVDDKRFHSLERKFRSLNQMSTMYTNSVIPRGKTIIESGTFGGDYLK